MQGLQMVLGPRVVALLAVVLVLQSGLIAYLLLRDPDSSRQLPPSPDAHQTPLAHQGSVDFHHSRPSPAKQPVVLGLATGYRWDSLRNFVVSLRYSGFAGDVVLFVAPEAKSDDELMQRLRFYNVTAVVVEAKFPYFEQGSFPRMMIEALLLPPMPELKAMNRRFHIMQLWLSAYGSFYDYVFITDTRDVIFQKHPFNWPYPELEDKLYVVLENSWYTISRQSTNARWYALAYGQSGLQEVKGMASHEKIICSGTTFGSTERMLWYLQRMNTAMRDTIALHEHRNRTAEDTVDRDIYDQPVHMYTIYKLDWGDKLVRLENAKSPVITLAAFSSFRRQSPILNNDGVVVNMVHQYDRYHDVRDTFNERYLFLERQSFLRNVSLTSIKFQQ